MTPLELDKYRITLADKLAELTNGSRDRGALAVEPTADEMDQTQGGQERDMAVGFCNRDAKLLSDLRSALNRIASGRFGICQDCELDISRKRLFAVPWAEFCIVCQEVADREDSPTSQPWMAARGWTATKESFESAA